LNPKDFKSYNPNMVKKVLLMIKALNHKTLLF
jgi:hypothetical protein